MTEPVCIVHLSDLHISEHLFNGADNRFFVPGRYGHDLQILQALDAILKELKWDILVITGDISRIGNSESFNAARNWLETHNVQGKVVLGLNLRNSNDQHYVVVPGNHDRFNGRTTQKSLDNYHTEFPPIQAGEVTPFQVRGTNLNFHLFDTSLEGGSFAVGKLQKGSMVSKKLDAKEIHIALLHHHFIQPPKHEREAGTELQNSAEVAAYLLNTPFDCVMFGHTHRSYIGISSVQTLASLLGDKRIKARWLRKILPQLILDRLDHDSLVSYRRERVQDGRYPKLAAYFDYLYLKKNGVTVNGPANFKTVEEFHRYIEGVQATRKLRNEMDEKLARKVLISLAPSACQEEAKWKGFHRICLFKTETDPLNATWDRYQFNGAQFEKVAPNLYLD